MNPQEDRGGVVYNPADDQSARVIAFFGPYLFWGVLGVLTGGVLLLVAPG